MTFLIVTDHNDFKHRINSESILQYHQDEECPGTYIEFINKEYLFIKESVEQVDKALQESYYTIKELPSETKQISTTPESTEEKQEQTDLGSCDQGHEGTRSSGQEEVRCTTTSE